MAFTRYIQAGAEFNDINELSQYSTSTYGSVDQATSSTKANSGTYSFRCGSTSDRPRGITFSATKTYMSGNVWFNHNGLNSSNEEAAIFVIPTTFATETVVYWKNSNDTLVLKVNGSTVATTGATATGISVTDVWFQAGVFYKADASAGVITFYLNGIAVLSYSGNTGTSVSGLYFGGSHNTSAWNNYCYFDDFYVDTSNSAESNTAPSGLKFLFCNPTAAGYVSGWTSSSGGANYTNVDERPPNSDTDYNSIAVDNTIDSYVMSDITLPSGFSVQAVIPTVYAKKTSGASDDEIKLGTRLASTNSLGAAQNLSTAYAYLFERQTTDPSGGSWSESDVNSAEFIIESAIGES